MIDVSADGLPTGVTCKGASISGNETSATLVFSASEDVKPGNHVIRISGTSKIESDAAVKAVAASQAALTKARTALPALDTALQKTVDPKTKAEAARKAAEATATADAAVAKAASDGKVAADKKLVDTQATAKTAAAAKVAADKAEVVAKATVTKADTELKVAQQELDKDKENQALKDKLAAVTTAKAEDDKTLVASQAAAKAAAIVAAATAAAVKGATVESTTAQQAFAKADAKAKQTDTALKAAVKVNDAALAAFRKAEAAKKAGDAAIVAATTDLAAKRKAKEAAIRVVSHPARTGTVVWNGTAAQPAVSRVSDDLTLSIMEEVAPYQVVANVDRQLLSHNRQLLIPVKLTKRNGFDNKVQLTFQKVPKNLQVQNLAIDKGKDEALLRVFVPTTVAEGTYTLFLQATGQVSYQKNLKRLERATVAQKAAVDALKVATDAAAAAKTAADAGTKGLATATAAQKAAAPKAAAAMKVLVAAQTTENAAVTAKAAADKAAVDALAKLDLASKAAEAAKVASEKDKENTELTKQHAAAQKTQLEAQAALDAAQKAATAAATKVTNAQKVSVTATAASTAAAKELTGAQAALLAATEAKKKTDAAQAAADAKVKEATTAKTAADNEHKAATAYSKAANRNVYAPSTPIVISVRKGAFTLTVAGGGDLKKGATVDVKVTLKRDKDFVGPVTVGLAVPPGTAGLSATPLTIAADQTEAVLTVSAAADATEGDIANLVVRGSTDWNGAVSADQTVKLKVVK
jgi:hypothetical protein